MTVQIFDQFKAYDNCVHGFTYKEGGVSVLPFGSQHMGVLSFHYQEEAWENVKHLIQSLALSPAAVVMTEQIHQDHLVNFKLGDSEGALKDGYSLHVLHNSDGVFTKEKNVLLMTFYADCTPVYFLDAKINAIGMVHSGWKGTKLNIACKGLQFMQSQFGSELSDLKIVIGPSAGACCYEVDQFVFDQFFEYPTYFKATTEGHYLMDTKGIIAKELMAYGILEDQIEISPDCTICQSAQYFSHRRDQGITGRMAAFMLLKE